MAKNDEDLIVASIAPNQIKVSISDINEFKNRDENSKLSIGSYIQIAEDYGFEKSIVGMVQSYSTEESKTDNPQERRCTLYIQPIGFYDSISNKFTRGIKEITIPPCNVKLASTEVLNAIYAHSAGDGKFSFGKLAQDDRVKVLINGNKFFSKHIGVVGSTGSGKSCAVARLIQEGITAKEDGDNCVNNSHVVIFDLHGEYGAAFPKKDSRYYVQHLSIENLKLPYWLMNSEELEDMFIESQEENSHNQVSQFKYAVIKNKGKYNSSILEKNISYDLPVYFSLNEVLNYLINRNNEVINKVDGQEHLPKLTNGSLVQEAETVTTYFQNKLLFVSSSTAKDNKAINGPYYGKFDRFISRLETKLSDRRLDFLLRPLKSNGEEYKTDDLRSILEQFTGYIDSDKANVTVIDLSGIPFEVLSIVVSLISRLLFEFCFYYKKKLQKDSEVEVPFLLVLEEAHNYIPKKDFAKFNSVKKSVERIAKEGRKYGISLMVVSQRPSEVSDTIFSQCNNFVAMRLTNPMDQEYVKCLLPDSIGNITENLPMLEQGEALLIGDSVCLPSVIQIDEPSPFPQSNDIAFYSHWKKSWTEITFDQLINEIVKRT